MIVLDYRDKRALYEQIVERFMELMFQGVLPQDTKLPSVRSLATELSINPNTIQRAYVELERMGYIYSVKGKGSFVADWEQIKNGREEEWEKEFDLVVEKGFSIGIAGEQMYRRLQAACEAFRKLQEDKEGESHDRSGESDEAL